MQAKPPTFRLPAGKARCVAAAAVFVAAGGLWAAEGPLGAASTDGSTFVPISPCRLFDTRPAPDNVGERAEPLGPDESFRLQATGSSGNCAIPESATAIAINATAVGATEVSWAAFYPAGDQRPLSSSLNYAPGASPTPNSIDVRLADDGRFEIYNRFGSVHLLGDVTGYYTGDFLDHVREAIDAKADASAVYTKAEIDALLAGLTPSSGYSDAEIDEAIAAAVAGKANAADVYTAAEVDGVVAAAVAGKADAADVYTAIETDHAIAAAIVGKADAADVYTQAELDAMHQMLYTKDEVDELLIGQRVWTASIAGDGSKLKDGPFTSSRFAVGTYRINFQLSPFDIPAGAEPVVVAQNRCVGSTYLFAKLPVEANGQLHSMTVDVFGFDTNGAFTDCPMDVMLRLD